MADVTDKDREAVRAVEAHIGLTLSNRERTFFATAIAQAREEGRREERAQIHAALNDLPEPYAYKHYPLKLDAFNEGVQHAMDAIRARGGATHSAADAASEV